MSQLIQAITADDHIQGDLAAPITLVLYGDYQCPYTRRALTHIKGLQRHLDKQICFVYRHFPAPPEIHAWARKASEVALAAQAQGSFWQMHDWLFHQRPFLADEDILSHAAQIGLDTHRLQQELATHSHQARLWRDLQGGWDSGVRAAPALFINNVRYEGEPKMAAILAAIESLLSVAS